MIPDTYALGRIDPIAGGIQHGMAVPGANIHITREQALFTYSQFGSLDTVQLTSASGKNGPCGDVDTIVVVLDPKSKIFQQTILIYFDAIAAAVDENPHIANITRVCHADKISPPGYFNADAPHRPVYGDMVAARNGKAIAAKPTA